VLTDLPTPTTTGRLLAVLSALQARSTWTGPQLAERLGVTVRTIRRDIERLRELGYPIDADLGVAGGYHLGTTGTTLPPLMLDDEEAVALAVCVRSAASDSVSGVAEAAVRALGKLEQTLPPRLRVQVDAISSSTARLPTEGPAADSGVLVALSRACRERDELAVSYRDMRGTVTERRIEPYRLVSAGRRWYLVARDRHHDDWRTFRVDRIERADATGHRFERDEAPDPIEFVQRAITTAPYRYQARVELDAPIDEMAERVPPTVGTLEAIEEGTTLLTTGADNLEFLALHIGLLGTPFRVLEPAELAERVAALAANLAGSRR
jgi:predicted DNA-binding transcriptional regulator YafY